MYTGVDYYPEHWQRDRWEIDAQLMREAKSKIELGANGEWVLWGVCRNNRFSS